MGHPGEKLCQGPPCLWKGVVSLATDWLPVPPGPLGSSSLLAPGRLLAGLGPDSLPLGGCAPRRPPAPQPRWPPPARPGQSSRGRMPTRSRGLPGPPRRPGLALPQLCPRSSAAGHGASPPPLGLAACRGREGAQPSRGPACLGLPDSGGWSLRREEQAEARRGEASREGDGLAAQLQWPARAERSAPPLPAAPSAAQQARHKGLGRRRAAPAPPPPQGRAEPSRAAPWRATCRGSCRSPGARRRSSCRRTRTSWSATKVGPQAGRLSGQRPSPVGILAAAARPRCAAAQGDGAERGGGAGAGLLPPGLSRFALRGDPGAWRGAAAGLVGSPSPRAAGRFIFTCAPPPRFPLPGDQPRAQPAPDLCCWLSFGGCFSPAGLTSPPLRRLWASGFRGGGEGRPRAEAQAGGRVWAPPPCQPVSPPRSPGAPPAQDRAGDAGSRLPARAGEELRSPASGGAFPPPPH